MKQVDVVKNRNKAVTSSELSYEKRSKKTKIINAVTKVVTYLFLGIWGLIVILPFYWMILTSFKKSAEYNSEVVPKFYTLKPTLLNYKAIFGKIRLADKELYLGQVMLNTLIFAVVCTVIMLIIILLAAYAFARLDFKGKNLVFTICLALMIVPSELVIITNYVTIANAEHDLRNTFLGLLLPSIMSIFYVYLLRQAFMQVPDELYYSAKIDGTSDLKYLFKVLVPMNVSTIVSILILKFIECWNLYIWPRLIINKADMYLVSQAIEEISSGGFGRANVTSMMAAVVIVSLPLIIIYCIFRKQIMTGVSRSGLKG